MILNSGGGVTFLWSDQVDAAAVGGVEAKVDGGGCARALRRREEDNEVKGHEGERKRMTLGHIYKAKGYMTGARIEEPKKWI